MIEIRDEAGTVLQKVEGETLEGISLANLYLRKANLKGANLRGANLRDADLREADLEGADLREARMEDAKFEKANLKGVNLRRANLRGADLRGANLVETDLRGACIDGANFMNADLKRANLSGIQCEGYDTSFQWACLEEADLSRFQIWHAKVNGTLDGANLQDAKFFFCDFSIASMQRVNLAGAELSHSNLRSTDLSGTDLSVARSLNGIEVTGAHFDKFTKWPFPSLLPFQTCDLEEFKRLAFVGAFSGFALWLFLWSTSLGRRLDLRGDEVFIFVTVGAVAGPICVFCYVTWIAIRGWLGNGQNDPREKASGEKENVDPLS